MKKYLTFLTGIVLLLTILIAGGCKSADNDDNIRDSNKVTIYLKNVVQIDGNNHLEMYNSYDKEKVVVDDLWTDVNPGMRVFWKPERGSGISIISRIGPHSGEGTVFKNKDAKKLFLRKIYRFRVPDDASGEEKYDIQFEDMEGHPTNIDPHLIIPDRKSSGDTEEEQ